MSILLIIGVSWALGTWALRALGREGSAAWALRFLLGMCLCGVLVFALGLHSFSLVSFAMYAVAVLGLGYELVLRRGVMAERCACDRWGAFERVLVGLTGAALAVSFVAAMAPAAGWEETAAHLPVVRAWAESGRFGYIEAEPFSAFATPVHALYAYTYSQDGEGTVRFLSWIWGLLACGAVYDLGRRLGGMRAGWIAAAIVATAPTFLDGASSVSVDLAVAALLAQGVALWLAWRQDGGASALVAAGFLLGNAAVVRPSGLVALGVLVALVGIARLLWRTEESDEAEEEADTQVYGVYFVEEETGGQGYLDFEAVVAADGSVEEHFEIVVEPGDSDRLWKGADEPFDDVDEFVYEPPRRGMAAAMALGESLGTVAAPALVALLPWWIYGVFAGAYAPGFPYVEDLGDLVAAGSGGVNARFLLPFLALLPAMAAWGIVRSTRWRAGMAGMVLVLVALQLGASGWRALPEVKGARGADAREAYRALREPNRPAHAWMREHAQGAVLSFDPQAYFVRGEVYRNYRALAQAQGQSREAWRDWLKARDIGYVLFPRKTVEAVPGYEGSRLARAVEELLGDGELFGKVEAWGDVEVYAGK